jgi:hypothetical protein
VQELVHEGVARFHHLARRAVGDDGPVVQQVQVVGDAQRRGNVVGDDDRGRAERGVERADEVHDHVQRDRVEAREGLVVDDELRVERDGARERDAARHAARELAGHERLRAAQPHRVELHHDEVAQDRLGQLRVLAHREGDVLEHREVAEEAALLEHHAHLAPQLVEAMAVERGHLAAAYAHGSLRRVQRSAHHLQQRGLARAAGAEDRRDAAARDVEVHAAQHRPAPVEEAQVADLGDVVGGVHCAHYRIRSETERLGRAQ